MIALQGPRSKEILQILTDTLLSNIRFYHFVDGNVGGNQCIISRTGYTGELGFEIYADSNKIGAIWDDIMAAGEDKGLMPAGLGCRDTLRIEMKYALYGNDINESINPIEAGLGWITRLEKGSFIGKNALLNAKSNLTRKLVCLKMTERAMQRVNAFRDLKGDAEANRKAYANSSNLARIPGVTSATTVAEEIARVPVSYTHLTLPTKRIV